MTVKIISRRMDSRKVTIKLVDGSLIHGKINLANDEGATLRVSDVFTKLSDPFIVVFDVTAEGKSGRVMILNKRNIAWVSPEDEPVHQDEERPPEPSGGSLKDRLRSS